MTSLRRVTSGRVRWHLALCCSLSLLAACSANPLSRKYEYEEELVLDTDGSATLFVNAAVPALVALRGVDLPLDPSARLDRQDVRAVFESPVANVVNVSLSRRDGRRYVHVRLDVPDVRRLSEARVFGWSTYALTPDEDQRVRFRQQVGASAARAVGEVGWTGSELVAFRLRLPSRVTFHNAPSREILRGNIIVWEQGLTQRLSGTPLDVEVVMDEGSILKNTLTLFGLVMMLVAITFAAFVAFVRSRGRKTAT
ncbi:MAG: hypothetical protein FJW29_07530 [Acidobacteria bacterium]|nr:hypothetical protein [Acidobacteriota bacterium]